METQYPQIEEVKDVMIRDLSGSPDKVNALLDFTVSKVGASGLKLINCAGWKHTLTECDPLLLASIAIKSP